MNEIIDKTISNISSSCKLKGSRMYRNWEDLWTLDLCSSLWFTRLFGSLFSGHVFLTKDISFLYFVSLPF